MNLRKLRHWFRILPTAILLSLWGHGFSQVNDSMLIAPPDVGAEAPSQLEVININGASRFSVESPRAGDTLSYILSVEWINPKVPVTVMAPDSLVFEGLTKLSASTHQKKIATIENGNPAIKSKIEFVYNLRATTPGTGKASSAKLEYFSALSSEKEYFTISPALINIGKARVPFHNTIYFKILLGLIFAGLLWGAFVFFKKLQFEKKKNQAQKPNAIRDEMKVIKSRLENGDSKSLLLEMEQLALRYLRENNSAQKGTTLSEMLPQHLKNQTEETRDRWEKVKAEFEFAKFGGGQKAPQEMLEIYQTLSKCFQLKKEESDE